MSNGSFLTSQLPVTTNATGSDRLLVLWNAIANAQVGSGTPQTMMIGLSDLINSAMSTIETDMMTIGTLSLGNSTVNTVINSTSLFIQTNLGTVFAVNTVGVIVGNGAGITSLSAPGSNTQIVFNNSGATGTDPNFTWNSATDYLTIGNDSVNTTVNSSVFLNGNVAINSTAFLTGNAGSVIVGNVTYNVAITPQSITVSNNGNTVWSVSGIGTTNIGTINSTSIGVSLTSSSITIGNSSVNSYFDDTTALLTGNSTVNLSINSTIIFCQSNTTANAILSNTGLIFNGNSSVNASVNTTSLVFQTNTTANSTLDGAITLNGNSSINASLNTTSLVFQTNSTANTTFDGAITLNGNSTINLAINSTAIAYNSIPVRPSSSLVLTNFNLAANSNSTVQGVFPTGQKTVTLGAATSYQFDALYMVSNSCISVNSNIQTSFGNNAAISSIVYTAYGSFSNNNDGTTGLKSAVGNTYITSNAVIAVLSGCNAAAGSFTLRLMGSLVTTGAVTIKPQVSWSAAINSTPLVLAGSYIRFSPLANSTQNNVGTWA